MLTCAAVTGWKSLFINRTFTTKINEVNHDESEMLLSCALPADCDSTDRADIFRLIAENHNLQCRIAWEAGDLVMWSNSAVQRASAPLIRPSLTRTDCATFDYADGTKRAGDRAVGIGEKPFFNTKSLSRREALALEGSPF